MKIEEGRLVERTCPDCGGVERRAFGESESDRGELASYALGWTSGHDDRVGYMTVGIGAGNAGGGTFHVEIRIVDDDWGMGLVDRPFETVPEGGPDLTREGALAHEDLAYVWFVADNVMLQDRRALWLEHWLKGTPAYVTPHVHGDPKSVRWVARDEERDFQLFEAATGDTDGGPVVLHLFHLLDSDPTLAEVLDLSPGYGASRSALGKPWVRERLEPR